MKQKKLNNIASQILELEKKCQDGENVEENMLKMTLLCESLSFEDLLVLANELESQS